MNTDPQFQLAPIHELSALTGTRRMHIETIHDWAVEFLTHTHQMLGRTGVVCPYTKPSLERGMFWAGVDESSYDDPAQLVELMEELAPRFLALPGEDGKDSVFKVALVVLPNVSNYEIIDAAHAELKNRFVSEGLMIGQFYPGCVIGGLWNHEFKPLDAPLPMLVIRHMVATDFPFLESTTNWLDVYMRKFAPSIPSQVRSVIVQNLVKAA